LYILHGAQNATRGHDFLDILRWKTKDRRGEKAYSLKIIIIIIIIITTTTITTNTTTVYLYVCVDLWREALIRADPPSKDSSEMHHKLILNWYKPEV
jgi:hypothetical protein